MAGPIQISILANARQANAEIQQTASRAQRLGGAFKKAAVPAAAALAGLGKAAFDASQAAAEDAAAAAQLAQALKTSTGATKAQVAQTESWIEAQGRAFGVADDELRPAIAKLAQATGSVTKAQKLAALAMDISAGTGQSLESVTKKLAKAQATGSAAALSTYGAKTKDAAGKTRDLAAVVGDLAGKYRGAAATAADTAAGKQKKLQLQMGELQEQIGAGLIPVQEKLTAIGLKVVGYFAKHSGVAKILAGVLAVVAVAVLAVNAAMALNPAVLVVAGLALLVGALIAAYQKSAQFRAIVQQVAGFITGTVVPALQALARFIVTQVVPAVVRIAQQIAAKLRPALASAAQFVNGALVPAIKKVAAKFREWWPTIQRVIVFVIKLYGKLLVFYATVLGKVIPIVIKVASFILTKVVPAVIDFVAAVVKIIKKLVEFGTSLGRAAGKVVEFARKVGAKVAEVVAFFIGLPAKVIGAVGDLGQTLYNAGADLISGFLDGIKDKFEEVKDFVGGAVSAIPGLKVRGTGGTSGSGFTGGFLPTGSLTGFNARSVYAAGAAAGATVINLNVTTPVGASSAEIGRELQRHLDTYLATGGRRRA
jgi:hypothetical protein